MQSMHLPRRIMAPVKMTVSEKATSAHSKSCAPGVFLRLCASSFPGNPVPRLHPGNRHPPNGHRLPAHSGCLTALYVHRGRIRRSIPGTGQNTAAFSDRNHIQHTSDSTGSRPLGQRTEAEWDLVEYQYLQCPERHHSAHLADVLHVQPAPREKERKSPIRLVNHRFPVTLSCLINILII